MKALPMIALVTLGVAVWQVRQYQPLSDSLATKNSATKNGANKTADTDWTREVIEHTDRWGRDISTSLERDFAPKLARWGRELQRQTGTFAQELPGFQSPAKPITGAQLSKYEKLLCDLANQERMKRKMSKLSISPALAEVARGHSREMAQKGFFDHNSPTPARRTVMNRYRAKFKTSPRLVAENIYKLQGPNFYKLSESDIRRAHTGWMNSPGHRANILRTNPAGGPTQIGVGIVAVNGSFWATQNFARPR